MVEPYFRPATADDADDLTWLEGIARATMGERRGGPFWIGRHAAQSPAWPAADVGDVLVSTIDDVVVGYLRFVVADAVLHVEDVFVHPEARELGCGDGLLAAATVVGRDRGADRIVAEALPGDRETKNLYERAGVKAILITVSAPITDESD